MSNLSISFPPLPAGYDESPDSFLQWISENAIFTQDGESLGGQVGGSRPTEDVGVWFGDTSIERFIDGEYRSVTDVPVGCVIHSAITGGTAPDNFLFCEGQSLLREDYPLLFAAIGTAWGTESGTTFNVPDLRGRVIVGADGVLSGTTGPGTYNLGESGFSARMPERAAGSYNGFLWGRNIPTYPDSPTAAQGAKHFSNNGGYTVTRAGTGGQALGMIEPPNAAMRAIIRYR